MLIEFRTSNFRSIREEQVLSLVAAKDKSLADTHVAAAPNKVVPAALRSAVIFGPNAGGKSNLLRALAFMRGAVAESAGLQPGQLFNVQLFRLDAAMAEQPSEFEITFALSGARYQYGFALTPSRIVEEWLLVYKTQKAQQWFSRKWDAERQQDTYEFSSHLTGQRKLWQEATRSNALFLSTAAQLNSEALTPVFRWIVDNIVVFLPATMLDGDPSTAMAQTSSGAQALTDLLKAADISISGIEIVKRKGVRQLWQMDGATGALHTERQDAEFAMPQFRHVAEAGSATFELGDESDGTQRLFALAGPLLEILRTGRVLVVDELDRSLHTMIVRRLVEWFHDSAYNTGGAQLVFTTHDTALLDQSLFRRDQIWFVEKTRDQTTRLYPLSEFSPRKGEALERGYLSGRYGAVPMLGDLPAVAAKH
jgi:uncharacterized protein